MSMKKSWMNWNARLLAWEKQERILHQWMEEWILLRRHPLLDPSLERIHELHSPDPAVPCLHHAENNWAQHGYACSRNPSSLLLDRYSYSDRNRQYTWKDIALFSILFLLILTWHSGYCSVHRDRLLVHCHRLCTRFCYCSETPLSTFLCWLRWCSPSDSRTK